MAVTVANIITNFDTYLGDTTNDRVSAAERLQYITEATVWLQEHLQNDHQNATYNLDYYDTVNYYKVTTAVADLLDVADLRRSKDLQTISFAHKSARELAEEIGQGATESSYAIERRDGNAYVVINHASGKPSKVISSMDAVTAGGGTWVVDATGSDALTLTADTVEKKTGTASLNFDIDVSQSGNNRATLYVPDASSSDLSEFEDLGAFFLWVYVPTVTYLSSVTLTWGDEASVTPATKSTYWQRTVTTDVGGSAFVAGWNRVKFNWADATKTGAPDVTSINYYQIDINYTGSQGDDTDYRVDELVLANPERLVFHYLSWNVGTNSGGTDVTVFGATTDVPYFSGQYDQYKFPVAHKAVSLAFKGLRLKQESKDEETEAVRALQRIQNLIPSSKIPELKSFKVRGIRFNKR